MYYVDQNLFRACKRVAVDVRVGRRVESLQRDHARAQGPWRVSVVRRDERQREADRNVLGATLVTGVTRAAAALRREPDAIHVEPHFVLPLAF